MTTDYERGRADERRAVVAWRRFCHLPKCRYCGKFVSGRHGWFNHGEYGEDTAYVCKRCLPNWTPLDSRGRGPEAGFCGIWEPSVISEQNGTNLAPSTAESS